MEEWGTQREIEDFEYPRKKSETPYKKKLLQGRKNYKDDKNAHSSKKYYKHGGTPQDTYESTKKTSNMQKAQ